MSQRPVVPATVTDPALARFLDQLARMQVASLPDLSTSATLGEMIEAYNNLVAAMRSSGAMES
jgi:hypothetical protein